MKLRKLKRLRQEWAGREEFLEHSVSHGVIWMHAGWRYLKELYGTAKR